MSVVRTSIAALLVYASTALAQGPAPLTLSIEVVDQFGAVIQGAHVHATNQTSNAFYDAVADPQGRAELRLLPGTYTLRVWANGFQGWEQTSLTVDKPTNESVALHIAQEVCEPCLSVEGPKIPVENVALNIELPLLPLESLPLPAWRIHRAHHLWFSAH